jgi:hypothetical protein
LAKGKGVHMVTEQKPLLSGFGPKTNSEAPEDFKTIEQGAATTVWCAVSPELNGKGGVYCEDCDIAPMVPADSKLLSGVRPWAVDKAAAETLWILSEKRTSVPAGSIA